MLPSTRHAGIRRYVAALTTTLETGAFGTPLSAGAGSGEWPGGGRNGSAAGGEVQSIRMEARMSSIAARSSGEVSGKYAPMITTRVPLTSRTHSLLC